MKKVLASLTSIGLMLVVYTMLAHDGAHKEAKGSQKTGSGKVTLVGEVIDTVCFLGHDSRGKDHVACAEECAKNGVPLAILDEKTNQLYLPSPQDHSNPNSSLMSFIGQRVIVTGQVLSKSGLKGISIESIKPAGAK